MAAKKATKAKKPLGGASTAKTGIRSSICIPSEVEFMMTQEDILKGVPGDANHCAIARTVSRQLGDNPSVNSDGIMVTINIPGIGKIPVHFDIPDKAINFIGNFDNLDAGNFSGDEKEAEEKAKKALAKLKPIRFKAKLNLSNLAELMTDRFY